jgi:hypothetical protein
MVTSMALLKPHACERRVNGLAYGCDTVLLCVWGTPPLPLASQVIGLMRDGGETNLAIARSMLEDVHVQLPPRPDVESAAPLSDAPHQSPRLGPMPSSPQLSRQGSLSDQRAAGTCVPHLVALELDCCEWSMSCAVPCCAVVTFDNRVRRTICMCVCVCVSLFFVPPPFSFAPFSHTASLVHSTRFAPSPVRVGASTCSPEGLQAPTTDPGSVLSPSDVYLGQAVVATLLPSDVTQWLEGRLLQCRARVPGDGASPMLASASGRLRVGQRIKALWRGGGWYDGCVAVVHPNGEVDVHYDDGDVERSLPLNRVQVRTDAGAYVTVREFLKSKRNG